MAAAIPSWLCSARFLTAQPAVADPAQAPDKPKPIPSIFEPMPGANSKVEVYLQGQLVYRGIGKDLTIWNASYEHPERKPVVLEREKMRAIPVGRVAVDNVPLGAPESRHRAGFGFEELRATDGGSMVPYQMALDHNPDLVNDPNTFIDVTIGDTVFRATGQNLISCSRSTRTVDGRTNFGQGAIHADVLHRIR
jgi:hypothetical protein